MQDTNLSLYIEINEVNFIFLVGKQEGENNYQITYKLETKLEGVEDRGQELRQEGSESQRWEPGCHRL